MIRFLLNVGINLIAAAIGLLLAAWMMPEVTLQLGGFIVATVVFAFAQGILGPFVFNVARQDASPILGGIGLVTTLIALVVASLFQGGLQIQGVYGWVLATLIVWIVTRSAAGSLEHSFSRTGTPGARNEPSDRPSATNLPGHQSCHRRLPWRGTARRAGPRCSSSMVVHVMSTAGLFPLR